MQLSKEWYGTIIMIINTIILLFTLLLSIYHIRKYLKSGEAAEVPIHLLLACIYSCLFGSDIFAFYTRYYNYFISSVYIPENISVGTFADRYGKLNAYLFLGLLSFSISSKKYASWISEFLLKRK